MKNTKLGSLITTLLLSFISSFFPAPALASQFASDLLSKVVAANERGDALEVGRLIERAETLWKDNQSSYFDFQTQAAALLVRSSASNQAALLTIFDNVTKKMPPKNVCSASDYFAKKHTLILRCSGLIEHRADRKRLLGIAHFIGELRTNMIPGYTFTLAQANFTPPLPPGTPFGPSGEPLTTNHAILNAYSNAIVHEDFRVATNQLQSLLARLDCSLTTTLFHLCARYPSSDPANAEFIKQIAAAARFTEEERKKL